MNLPPFVYSKAFWQALSLIVATLVAYFTPYKLEAAAVEAVVFALLQLLGVTPELQNRGFHGWFKR